MAGLEGVVPASQSPQAIAARRSRAKRAAKRAGIEYVSPPDGSSAMASVLPPPVSSPGGAATVNRSLSPPGVPDAPVCQPTSSRVADGFDPESFLSDDSSSPEAPPPAAHEGFTRFIGRQTPPQEEPEVVAATAAPRSDPMPLMPLSALQPAQLQQLRPYELKSLCRQRGLSVRPRTP